VTITASTAQQGILHFATGTRPASDVDALAMLHRSPTPGGLAWASTYGSTVEQLS